MQHTTVLNTMLWSQTGVGLWPAFSIMGRVVSPRPERSRLPARAPPMMRSRRCVLCSATCLLRAFACPRSMLATVNIAFLTAVWEEGMNGAVESKISRDADKQAARPAHVLIIAAQSSLLQCIITIANNNQGPCAGIVRTVTFVAALASSASACMDSRAFRRWREMLCSTLRAAMPKSSASSSESGSWTTEQLISP